MDNSNSKILTMWFAAGAALSGFTLHVLIKIFSGVFGWMARIADMDLVKHGVPIFFGLALFIFFQFTPKLRTWGEEVVTEVRKVVWPSRRDTTAMTIIVVIMVLISSVIISSFDLLSGFAINSLMK